MKIQRLVTFALLAFVIGSVVFPVAKESRRTPAVAPSSSGPSAPAKGHKVIAYSFHGNFRCVSWVKIEARSRKVVTEGFPEEIRFGRLEFRDVNVDQPQNRHFIDDDRLSSKSPVIVEIRDGRQVRWRNLEKVWTLLDSKQEFVSCGRDGVSGYLKSARPTPSSWGPRRRCGSGSSPPSARAPWPRTSPRSPSSGSSSPAVRRWRCPG